MPHNITMDSMSSNQTAAPSAGDDDAIGYLLFVLHIVLAFFLLVCNTLTIAAICLTHDLQTLTNAHVANLAFADLLMGVATLIQCFLFLPETRDAYDDNLYVCILFYYVLPYTSAFQSQFCLLLIAFDRLLYIAYPLNYPVYVTEKSVTVSIVGSWVLAFALGGVPIYWNSYDSSRPTNRCVSEEVMNTLYYWELLPGTMLGSIVVATVCYVRIILIARTQRRRSKVNIPLSLMTIQTHVHGDGAFRRRTNIGIDQHQWKAYSTTDIPNHVLQLDTVMPVTLCATESALQDRRNTLPLGDEEILKIHCVTTDIASHLSNSAPSCVESINPLFIVAARNGDCMDEGVNDDAPIQNSDEINDDCVHQDTNHNSHNKSEKCRVSSHLSKSDDSWGQRTTGHSAEHLHGLCPSMHAAGSVNGLGGCMHDEVNRLSNDLLTRNCLDTNKTLTQITTCSRLEDNVTNRQFDVSSVHETFSDDAPIRNNEHVNGACTPQRTEHSSTKHDENAGACPSDLLVHEPTGTVHITPLVHAAIGKAYSTDGCARNGVNTIPNHLSDNEPVTSLDHMNGSCTQRTTHSSAELHIHDNGKTKYLNGTLTAAHIYNDSPVGCCIHIQCTCSPMTNFPVDPYADKENCPVNAISECNVLQNPGEFHHNGEINGTNALAQPCQDKTVCPISTVVESKDLQSSREFHQCEEHQGTVYDETCEYVHLLEEYDGYWDLQNDTAELQPINPLEHATTGAVYSIGGCMHKEVKDLHHLEENYDGDCHNSKKMRRATMHRGSTVSVYVEDTSDSDNTRSPEFLLVKTNCGGSVDARTNPLASTKSIDVDQYRENGANKNTDSVRPRDSYHAGYSQPRHSREMQQSNPLEHAATATVNSTGDCVHNGVKSDFVSDSEEFQPSKDSGDSHSPHHLKQLSERRLTLVSRNSIERLSPLMCAAPGNIYSTVGRTSKGVKALRHFRDFQPFSEHLNKFFYRRRSGARSVYMFFTVNILFAVCWIPYLLAILLGDTAGVDHTARAFLFFVASCNSGVNFVIYAWKTKDFRRAYRRLIVCKCTVR